MDEVVVIKDIYVLVFLVEVKRLAEKEDWIVDNEGLTSLVSSNFLQ